MFFYMKLILNVIATERCFRIRHD